MFIEKPERNFTLKLTQENEEQSVWTCVIREGQFQIIPQDFIYIAYFMYHFHLIEYASLILLSATHLNFLYLCKFFSDEYQSTGPIQSKLF